MDKMWRVCGREKARAKEKVLEREREGNGVGEINSFIRKNPALKCYIFI